MVRATLISVSLAVVVVSCGSPGTTSSVGDTIPAVEDPISEVPSTPLPADEAGGSQDDQVADLDATEVRPTSGGFVLPTDSGFYLTDITTAPSALVPSLEYEQVLMEGAEGWRVSITASQLGSPVEEQMETASIDGSSASGYVTSGSSYVEVTARAAGEASGDPLAFTEQVLQVLNESDLELVKGDVSLLAESLRTLGLEVVDDRSRYAGDANDLFQATFTNDDGRRVFVTWREVPESLTLEIATSPYAFEFRSTGDRTIALAPAFSGEAARSSWIQDGYLVSVLGGTELDESIGLASAVVRVDATRMAAMADQFRDALGARPSDSELVQDNGVKFSSKLAFDSRYVCYVSEDVNHCEEASLLATAAPLSVDGSNLIVGNFPSQSDLRRIEVDGEVPTLEDDGLTTWFVVDLGSKTEATLSLTVGDVPTQTADVVFSN